MNNSMPTEYFITVITALVTMIIHRETLQTVLTQNNKYLQAYLLLRQMTHSAPTEPEKW